MQKTVNALVTAGGFIPEKVEDPEVLRALASKLRHLFPY